ncbi:hypothetical protein PhCBS80983_g04620 [Powellomyces hirtus]|uniref:Uncharacterized protein n=1 Tax=Powellomyces hirtus TaxID=109895 RepID=A0A507DXY0_9FUNG|nr:hypothetical protein PhCBS80983_g04620 [Powellomyces hirtus]
MHTTSPTTTTTLHQPRVLRPSASANTIEPQFNHSDASIAMPAPKKPLALRGLHHMLVPRLDTSSPSLNPNSSDNSAVWTGHCKCLAPSRGSSRKEAIVLSPLHEDVESPSKSSYGYGDDAAVAELMEILGTRKNDEQQPAPSDTPASMGHQRKSSVPYLFQGPEGFMPADAPDAPIVVPPRLSGTPFKPTDRRSENDNSYQVPAAPSSGTHTTGHSPVSRARNPLPFNSPFLNRRRAPSPLTVPTAGSASPLQKRDSHAELGLLSPSPEPRAGPYFFHRPPNPIQTRLADLSCAAAGTLVESPHRPRSKSVTDLDGRIRIAFAC